MRFQVINEMVGAGFGAVRIKCLILDTHGKQNLEYTSTEFDRQKQRYISKKVTGEWVEGVDFRNKNHAECFAASLNLGHSVLEEQRLAGVTLPS